VRRITQLGQRDLSHGRNHLRWCLNDKKCKRTGSRSSPTTRKFALLCRNGKVLFVSDCAHEQEEGFRASARCLRITVPRRYFSHRFRMRRWLIDARASRHAKRNMHHRRHRNGQQSPTANHFAFTDGERIYFP
jgi:hypothetical protein